jgi:hypothetical protein
MPATSDKASSSLGLLKFVSGGRDSDMPTVPQGATISPVAVRPVIDNTMTLESDPGPFELATKEMVDKFGPVLVILPEVGDIDMVLVELSPLDVYYREKLRLDNHSMTYFSSLPSFEELRLKGYSFELYSSTKDFVSNSFTVLRGTTNELVGSIMDDRMPDSNWYSAQFKLLAYHGQYQSKRDSGNEAGGVGKGYRVDFGACDHNYQQDNMDGIGSTPRTNGGVKCFDELSGIEEVDSVREHLRNYFGSLMDSVQLIVVEIREENGYTRIYDELFREESFAAKV